MKISLYNASTDKTIVLGTETVVIGREFFSSTDKRIARTHGQITVLETEIKVKSTHENPIFYKLCLPEFKILYKNEEISLGHGHYFSLLPNEHIYEIRVTNESLAGNPDTQTTSSDSKIINKHDQSHNVQFKKRNDSTSSSNRSITPDLDLPEPSDLHSETLPIQSESPGNIQQPSSSCSGKKRSANEDANEDANKKKKNDEPLNINLKIKFQLNQEDQSNVIQTSTVLQRIKPDPDGPVDQPSTVTPIIKPDPDGPSAPVDQPSTVTPIIKPDPDGPSSSVDQPSTAIPIIKPDPDGPSTCASSTSATSVKTEPDNTTSSVSSPRTVCQFGIRCYRHNSDHRREHAHPGDEDYRRPDFLPAPETAPDCEYGASCYRRNPQHFIEFKHLPPNTNQSPPITNNIIPQNHREPRPDRELIYYNNDNDHDTDDEFNDYDDSDEDYQRGRNDRTSSDDEENNCEE